ncbi:hypothetical protein [Hyalangium versicolor]|uniref:hypothetical protein n=1 Tax=Hyalangium versicolor TaxID=2861190 RepID=UPI001CCCA046|nr:hypothetical protein [Hyalangium versicolor]
MQPPPPPPPYDPQPVNGVVPDLTRDHVPVVARAIAQGLSLPAAAARVSATKAQLQQWLRRGERDAAEGKWTVYSHLLLAVEQAKAHREEYLVELGDQAAQDKTLNVRWVTWSLSMLRPLEYSARAPGEAGTSGFALISPEEAVASVHQFLADFLSRHAVEAKASEPMPVEGPLSGG